MSNKDLEVSTAGVVVALGRALSLAALFERMQMAECEVCLMNMHGLMCKDDMICKCKL
jgi:hypothetical protein